MNDISSAALSMMELVYYPHLFTCMFRIKKGYFPSSIAHQILPICGGVPGRAQGKKAGNQKRSGDAVGLVCIGYRWLSVNSDKDRWKKRVSNIWMSVDLSQPRI